MRLPELEMGGCHRNRTRENTPYTPQRERVNSAFPNLVEVPRAELVAQIVRSSSKISEHVVDTADQPMVEWRIRISHC